MFEVGDKVVCIHTGRFWDKVRGDDGVHLKVGRTYEVLDTKESHEDTDTTVKMILITDGGFNNKRWCVTKRFMSMLDFRRKKLEKIYSKLNKN